MQFITKCIFIPDDAEVFDDDIFSAAQEMAKIEEDFVKQKLEPGFSYEGVYQKTKAKCPNNCGARTLNVLGIYTNPNRTKRILHLTCLNCSATIFAYQELEETN